VTGATFKLKNQFKVAINVQNIRDLSDTLSCIACNVPAAWRGSGIEALAAGSWLSSTHFIISVLMPLSCQTAR